VLAMEPSSSGATVCLVAALAKQGRHQEASQAVVDGLRRADQEELADRVAAMEPEEALEWLDRRRLEALTRQRSRGVYVPPTAFALTHATLGEFDATFEALERGLREHDRGLLLVRVHPYYDSLRGDPRLEDLLARAGL